MKAGKPTRKALHSGFMVGATHQTVAQGCRAFYGKVLGRRKLCRDVPEFCIGHLRVLEEHGVVSAQDNPLPGLAENSYRVVEI